jgi:hypothetical protein
MASNFTPRSFCIETRYKVPATDKAWPAFWWYAKDYNGDASEIDIEQPNTPNQGVHDVTFYNHTYLYDSIDIGTPDFTTPGMTYARTDIDFSAAPHTYTTCYDDATATVTHWVDTQRIYTAAWKWNLPSAGRGQGTPTARRRTAQISMSTTSTTTRRERAAPRHD